MNATKIFAATTFAAVASFAALAAVGAQAGEVDLTPLLVFHSTASVAQVRAGAIAAAQNPHGDTGANYRPARVVKSDLARATVRSEAVVAQRSGKIGHGEANVM